MDAHPKVRTRAVCVYWDIYGSIGAINMCTNFEINWYTIDEFRKHTKID